MELVDFLRARLDEDEAAARRAASYDDGASHDVQGPAGTWACLDEAEWFGASYRGGVIAPRIGYTNAPELGAHIARHDPARVLAEVEAKRAVVDFADTYEGSFHASQFLPKLAAVYRNHPDFDPAWLED